MKILRLFCVIAVGSSLGACAFSHQQYKTQFVSDSDRNVVLFEECAITFENFNKQQELARSPAEYFLFHQSNCERPHSVSDDLGENGQGSKGDILSESKGGDEYGNYTFGVIEFDDQGELFDDNQLNEIQERIKKISSKRPVIFSLFIHGWRNNASETSSNLISYRQFIQGLGSETCLDIWVTGLTCEELALRHGKPHVLGVYLGWRGDPTGLNSVRELFGYQSRIGEAVRSLQLPSIYNRKNGVKRVSSIRATQTILSLIQSLDIGDAEREEKFRLSRSRRLDEALRSKKILIGHSFGARFLENALAQSFIGRKHLSNQLSLEELVDSTTEKIRKFDKSIDSSRQSLDELLAQEKQQANSLYKLVKNTESSCGTSESLRASLNAKSRRLDEYFASEIGLDIVVGSFSSFIMKVDELAQKFDFEAEGGRATICSDSDLRSDNADRCDVLDTLDQLSDEFVGIKTRLEQKTISKEDLEQMRGHLSPSLLGRLWDGGLALLGHVAGSMGLTSDQDLDITELKTHVRDRLEEYENGVLEQEKFDHLQLLEELVSLRTDRARSKGADDKCLEGKRHLASAELGKEALATGLRELADLTLREIDYIEADLLTTSKLVRVGLFPPADLAILVNPATEAMQAKMLVESMCEDKSFLRAAETLLDDGSGSQGRRPWMIAIKSDGDEATGPAFRILSTLEADWPTKAPPRRAYSSHRGADSGDCKLLGGDQSQRRYVVNTAPSLEEFHTHYLHERSKPNSFPIDQSKRSDEQPIDDKGKTIGSGEDLLQGMIRGHIGVGLLDGLAVTSQDIGFVVDDREFSLLDRRSSVGSSPIAFSDYWMFSVPKSIIPDHSDIFKYEFGHLLGALVKTQASNFCVGKPETAAPNTQVCSRLDEQLSYCQIRESLGCILDKLDRLEAKVQATTQKIN